MVIQAACERAAKGENSIYDILFQNDLLRFGMVSKVDGRSWHYIESDILTELLAVAEEWYTAREAVTAYLDKRDAEIRRIEHQKAINNMTFLKRLANAKSDEEVEQARNEYEKVRKELEEANEALGD